jgi:hypothetical protein
LKKLSEPGKQFLPTSALMPSSGALKALGKGVLFGSLGGAVLTEGAGVATGPVLVDTSKRVKGALWKLRVAWVNLH